MTVLSFCNINLKNKHKKLTRSRSIIWVPVDRIQHRHKSTGYVITAGGSGPLSGPKKVEQRNSVLHVSSAYVFNVQVFLRSREAHAAKKEIIFVLLLATTKNTYCIRPLLKYNNTYYLQPLKSRD